MNNKLSIELFKFSHKTDYLPYYKKYTTAYNNEDTVLDLLNTLNKDEKFSFTRVEEYGIKINNLFVKTTDLVHDIVSATSNDFIIEPVSSYRAIEDLTINNDDFFEKLNIFNKYLSTNEKEEYTKNLQFEYYASNTLNINKNYIGDHSIIIASDIIANKPELKNEVIELINDKNNGVWYTTSKDTRVLHTNTVYKTKIETLIQEVTKYQQTNTHYEEKSVDTISQKFTDFNIAVYDINDTDFLEKSILNSDAKYVNINSKNDDLAFHSQSVNKTFSYEIAGNILLEAKDNNADFIVVKSENAFKLFDNKQKEIEKVVGRDIQLPIITIKQFNHILSGEKDYKTLGFNNHKIAVPFL